MVKKDVFLLTTMVIVLYAINECSSTSYSCNPPDTFEKKLDRVVEYDDSDRDGVISPRDMDRSYIYYDLDLDSFVSLYEFVAVWTCRYGDKPDIARRIFNQMTRGMDFLTFDLYRNRPNTTVQDYRKSLYSYYTRSEITG